MTLTEKKENEVIEQLREYKAMIARIKVLERYPIGAGMHISLTSEDDLLQELHRQLRGMPSYMYLTKREQELETVASAYLEKYPTGMKSQLYEVRSLRAVSDVDRERLNELIRKMEKVYKARTGTLEGFEGVLQRISEIQDLESKIKNIDFILYTMNEYLPQYVTILRERYIEDKPIESVCEILNISRRTFDRWRPKAIEEYARLAAIAGMTQK